MSSKVEFWGDTYDEHTDWRGLVARGYFGHGWEAKWADAATAFGELAEALVGTPMAIALADAALEVIEHGDNEAMHGIESAGWGKAPNAYERILTVLRRSPRTLPNDWVARLYSELFRQHADDPKMLAEFTRDAAAPGGHELLVYAARYNPEWLAEHLATLRPPTDADICRWLYVAGVPEAGAGASRAPSHEESSRARLVEAIVRLGGAYVSSLLSQAEDVAARFPGSALHRTVIHALQSNSELADRVGRR